MYSLISCFADSLLGDSGYQAILAAAAALLAAIKVGHMLSSSLETVLIASLHAVDSMYDFAAYLSLLQVNLLHELLRIPCKARVWLSPFQHVHYQLDVHSSAKQSCLQNHMISGIVQGAVLPRETRAAAAVAFSAAWQVPHVHPAVTALQVARACCPNDSIRASGRHRIHSESKRSQHRFAPCSLQSCLKLHFMESAAPKIGCIWPAIVMVHAPDHAPVSKDVETAFGTVFPNDISSCVPPNITVLSNAECSCSSNTHHFAGGIPDGTGFVDRARPGKQGSVVHEFMADAEQIAKICMLRGLVSGLPTAVWLEQLSRIRPQISNSLPNQSLASATNTCDEQMLPICSSAQQEASQSWCLLMDGVLPMACRLAEEATDAHTQYHAQVLISSCLLQMLDCRKVGKGPEQSSVMPNSRMCSMFTAAHGKELPNHLLSQAELAAVLAGCIHVSAPMSLSFSPSNRTVDFGPFVCGAFCYGNV